MRPIPVPFHIEAAYPAAHKDVIGAPNGDLLDTEIAPVEVLHDPAAMTWKGQPGAGFRMYWVPEEGELEALFAGGVLEITVVTEELPTTSVVVFAPVQILGEGEGGSDGG